MAIDPNEKELSTWGIAGGFRTGFITFFLALLTMAVVTLFTLFFKSQNDRLEDKQKQIEELKEYLRPTTERMNNVANKVDTAATKVITSADKVDSLTTQFNNRKNLK